MLARSADEHGAQIIAVNRPGFAGSSFQPGRTMLDWPDDAVAVADEIGVDQLPVLGYSGGGPYALVCGALRPDRFPQVGVAAGAGPYQGTHVAAAHESERPWHDHARPAPARPLGRVALRAYGHGRVARADAWACGVG